MPPTPEPDLQTAARLLADGRSGDAVDRLAALVAEAPVYAAAHVLLATALEADGRPAEALASWGRVAALVPSSPLVHRERRRLLDAARPAPDAAPPAEVPEPSGEAEAPAGDGAPETADAVLADAIGDVQPGGAEGTLADEPAGAAQADEGPGGEVWDDDVQEGGEVAYDLRPVDERFLRDDDDLAERLGDGEDDETVGGPDDEGVDPGALFDPSDIFEGIAAAPGGRAHAAPAAPPDTEHAGPAAPGGATDAAPPRPDALADELDALISRLGEAPPIRPDPDFSGPVVQFDDAGADEMASETLAKIYAAQRQYGRAADVYETLAARDPDRADDLRRQADEMRQRR